MKLKEKYKLVEEGSYSKKQFKQDVIHEMPGLITKLNSYDDTVRILKNKGILESLQKEEQSPDYSYEPEFSEDKYSLEEINRGVDYELEKAGVDSTGSVSKEDYMKAFNKAIQKLDNNRSHYLDLISTNKKHKGDKYTEYKSSDSKDSLNSMQKQQLKESVKVLIKKILTDG